MTDDEKLFRQAVREVTGASSDTEINRHIESCPTCQIRQADLRPH